VNKSKLKSFAATLSIALLTLVLIGPSFLGSSEGLFVGKVEEIILKPIADSYVDSAYPDENYGDEEVLKAATEGETRGVQYSYLMFDLSEIPPGAKVRYATLSIGLKKMSGRGKWGYISISAHFCPDNSWSEREITWNNKPEFAEKATDYWGFAIISFATKAHFEIAEDVQRALVDGGRLTEVITWGSGSGYAVLSSRESRTPSLVVGYIIPPFNVVSIDSSQDTGETSNLGYICLNAGPEGGSTAEEMESAFCEYAITLPKKVDMNPIKYTIAYVRGYSFLRWETSGDVHVKDPNDKVTTLEVKGDGTLKAIGSSQLIEYGYEELDGAVERRGTAGQAFFVKFTPIFSGHLKTARFYFTRISENATKNEIKVHVLDENRADMMTPIVAKPTSGSAWFDVDLSGHNLAVTKGSDFYIGLELTNSWPVLGVDYDDPDNRSWSYSHERWSLDKGADYMIRAIVERAELPTTKITTPTPSPAPTTPTTYTITSPGTQPTTALPPATTPTTIFTKTERMTATSTTTIMVSASPEVLMLYFGLIVSVIAVLVVVIVLLFTRRKT